MPPAGPTPAERAIATAIFAPIGLGAKVVDDLPDVVEKARQRLVFARFIGKMAVDQSMKDLRGRIADLTATPPAEPFLEATVAERIHPRSADDVAGKVSAANDPDTDDVIAPSALALPDYDQLAAAHIIGKLAGLTDAELDAVEAYESANRHRRTVLGKISQLRGV